MPRGRKKADTTNVILNNENNNIETAAEITAPVEVKAEQSQNNAKTEKPKSKAGRKPKAAASKITKTETASKSETAAKSAATADTDKPKKKAGRKPKTENVVAAEAPKADKKASVDENKTPAKRGRKPSNANKSAAPVPAPVDTAAVTTEKKKRAYNKKTKTSKTAKSEDVIIQSSGNEYSMSDITEMCKNDYRGGTRKQIKSITIYIKAENNVVRAYYVVNDSASGHIDL